MVGNCWNNECPRCPAFNVDAFDPKNENAFMRVPVAPFANDSITTSLCLKPEDLSRKRKRRSLDATPTAGVEKTQADGDQVASPTSDAKKAKKDVTKSKKTPTAPVDKDAKNAEKATKKKASKPASDQSDAKRSRRSKEEKSPTETTAPSSSAEAAAETGESSPSSAFRPHYDSVFSR
ncbi:unnamed protein product [Phytophthora lilii]|uniref:Unnamed protein product n=1 Tax=Phytophthora lilii TaxID=2077276 RepID=A0A9W6TK10_9STRA|nr:unnamed protein product [Phytophthora lilii]